MFLEHTENLIVRPQADRGVGRGPGGPPYPALAACDLRFKKHSRQYTGRPCLGSKGTVVSRPHCEQTVLVSVLPALDVPACRLPLHALQRLGSCLKFMSWKKCCSPAVKTNSAPHSEHLRIRSWNSAITPTWFPRTGCGADRVEACPPVLFDFPARLFPVPLTGQGTLDPLFLSRLQVEGVSLDLLDDVLLLDLSFEAPKSVFERFAILQFYFSQTKLHLQTRPRFPASSREGTDIIKWLTDKVKSNLARKAVPTGQPCAQLPVFQ